MEAQVVSEPVVQAPEPAATKQPLLKRIPKWAIYTILALIVAAILGYGYTQNWFKNVGLGHDGKKDEVIGSVVPGAVPAGTETAAADAVSGARQAFASGDMQGAIKAYQAVLAQNPSNLDALGELGNVYYRAGWMQQASQTYYDAATKAIEQNRLDVAESLLPVIVNGNPMLASQLEERMFEAQDRAMEAQMAAQMPADDMSNQMAPQQPMQQPVQQQAQQQPMPQS